MGGLFHFGGGESLPLLPISTCASPNPLADAGPGTHTEDRTHKRSTRGAHTHMRDVRDHVGRCVGGKSSARETVRQPIKNGQASQKGLSNLMLFSGGLTTPPTHHSGFLGFPFSLDTHRYRCTHSSSRYTHSSSRGGGDPAAQIHLPTQKPTHTPPPGRWSQTGESKRWHMTDEQRHIRGEKLRNSKKKVSVSCPWQPERPGQQ